MVDAMVDVHAQLSGDSEASVHNLRAHALGVGAITLIVGTVKVALDNHAQNFFAIRSAALSALFRHRPIASEPLNSIRVKYTKYPVVTE